LIGENTKIATDANVWIGFEIASPQRYPSNKNGHKNKDQFDLAAIPAA
jgi:hypothetical protein